MSSTSLCVFVSPSPFLFSSAFSVSSIIYSHYNCFHCNLISLLNYLMAPSSISDLSLSYIGLLLFCYFSDNCMEFGWQKQSHHSRNRKYVNTIAQNWGLLEEGKKLCLSMLLKQWQLYCKNLSFAPMNYGSFHYVWRRKMLALIITQPCRFSSHLFTGWWKCLKSSVALRPLLLSDFNAILQ